VPAETVSEDVLPTFRSTVFSRRPGVYSLSASTSATSTGRCCVTNASDCEPPWRRCRWQDPTLATTTSRSVGLRCTVQAHHPAADYGSHATLDQSPNPIVVCRDRGVAKDGQGGDQTCRTVLLWRRNAAVPGEF